MGAWGFERSARPASAGCPVTGRDRSGGGGGGGRVVTVTATRADTVRRAAAAGVAGALCITFSAILVKLADVSPSAAAVYPCASALPWLLVIAAWPPRRFGPRDPRERRFPIAAGVLLAIDLICWHQAIR